MYANVDGYQKIRNFLEPKQGNEKGSEDKIPEKPVGNNHFFLEWFSKHYGKNPFLKIFLGKLFSGIEFWTCQKYVQGRKVEGTFSENSRKK